MASGVNIDSFNDVHSLINTVTFFFDVMKEEGSVKNEIVKALYSLGFGDKRREKIESVCPSPSDLGNITPAGLKARDKVQPFDHRGRGLLSIHHGLHVSLQVEAFGKFIDCVSKDEIDSRYFTSACEIMQKMSLFYGNEALRKTELIELLKDVLSDFYFGTKSWGSGSNAESDVAICIEHGGEVIGNIEIKNEFGQGGKDAVTQNIGYFIKFQSKHKNRRSPMILISLVGCHYLQVFGAAWNGGNICMDPLCSPVSLLFVPHDPINGICKVATVLDATVNTLKELKQHLSSQSVQSVKCSGPYYLENFQSVIRMEQKLRLFECVGVDGTACIVKFVQSYGLKVHQYLQERNAAPKIVAFTELAGGWKAVVMEKLCGDTLCSLQINQTIVDALTQIVKDMHSANFVHGDLRPQNILCSSNNTITILDFDWAGQDGVAKYPVDINPACKWPSGVAPGELITKTHDIFQIEEIVKNQK